MANFDKKAFASGIVVGRQLRGWSTCTDESGIVPSGAVLATTNATYNVKTKATILADLTTPATLYTYTHLLTNPCLTGSYEGRVWTNSINGDPRDVMTVPGWSINQGKVTKLADDGVRLENYPSGSTWGCFMYVFRAQNWVRYEGETLYWFAVIDGRSFAVSTVLNDVHTTDAGGATANISLGYKGFVFRIFRYYGTLNSSKICAFTLDINNATADVTYLACCIRS